MEIHALNDRDFDRGFSELGRLDCAGRICDAYEREWLAGRSPRVEDDLGLPPAEERAALRRELELLNSDYADRRTGPQRGFVAAGGSRRGGRYSLRKPLGKGAFGRV